MFYKYNEGRLADHLSRLKTLTDQVHILVTLQIWSVSMKRFVKIPCRLWSLLFFFQVILSLKNEGPSGIRFPDIFCKTLMKNLYAFWIDFQKDIFVKIRHVLFISSIMKILPVSAAICFSRPLYLWNCTFSPH